MPTDTAAEPCDLDDDAVAASHGDELPDEGQCEADPAERRACARLAAKPWICSTIGPLQAIVDGLDAVRELVRLLSTHKLAVPAKDSEGCPPEVLLRSHPRKERNEAWKQGGASAQQ